MYWYKSRRLAGGQAEIFAEEERDELPLVNRLRSDVKRWRDAGYRGASKVTRDLLAHWRREDAPRPLFFCQIEAAETAIWLTEVAPNAGVKGKAFLEHLASANNDADPGIMRLALKLATGAG